MPAPSDRRRRWRAQSHEAGFVVNLPFDSSSYGRRERALPPSLAFESLMHDLEDCEICIKGC
jgi:hypothetical protein